MGVAVRHLATVHYLSDLTSVNVLTSKYFNLSAFFTASLENNISAR